MTKDGMARYQFIFKYSDDSNNRYKQYDDKSMLTNSEYLCYIGEK